MVDPKGVFLRRNIVRRALAFRTRKYVAVSQDLYRWLGTTVRIPQDKLEFIPNGVDTDRFRPGRDRELRLELGIGEEEFVVGAIGRLDPIKNYGGLINSVRLLSRSEHRVRLVIVGDGPARAGIESALLSSNLSPQPLLPGYRPDVERLYRLFDVFVLNSFAEGMSNTLLEAMASGLPIVCTPVGGNTELIEKNRGMLVDSADDEALANAILQYKTNPELRSTHGRNARQFVVENFSLGSMISRYVSLYESVA
jgi:glycosyltransferase involved in cell wall biosynthesis